MQGQQVWMPSCPHRARPNRCKIPPAARPRRNAGFGLRYSPRLPRCSLWVPLRAGNISQFRRRVHPRLSRVTAPLHSHRSCLPLLTTTPHRSPSVPLAAGSPAITGAPERRRCEESRSVTYGPMLPRDMERIANLRFIYESDDTHCVNLLRRKRAPFFQLCDLFRARLLLRDSIHSTIEEQVAMFLHVVGHNQRFRVISLIFRRSIETISRYFQEVLYAVGELRNEMIVPPATSVHPRIQNSRRWYPYFKGAGENATSPSLAGSIQPPKMSGAVDFDLRFTYVLARREGSAHDALILADALERNDGLRVPPGKFYLVDVGYAVRPGFLPPYRGTRYHLREFGNNRPRDQRELFNLRHSFLRVTVERAFGALKNRFKILYNNPFHPFKTQVKLVLAYCILHNWIRAR
ncbi:hypothetical protein U9M48_019488 [Paspalum notatum var. saurae]|uniref:DDE Tnp4 domain-containing protein n=1 Tax=Paspalum notatum var. saurae TaxID=547442 RepID=A0AAQ3TF36_PASNO